MAFAEEESLTITTYYPSPYGSYRELSAHRMKIGLNYSTQTVTDNNLIVEGQIGVGTTNIPGRTKLVVDQGLGLTSDYSAFFRGRSPGIVLDSNAGVGAQFRARVIPTGSPGVYLWSVRDTINGPETRWPLYIDASSITMQGGNVRITGALDVWSTTGALIVPRMTTAQRDALISKGGMIIYNTSTNQFNFYENGAWVTKD